MEPIPARADLRALRDRSGLTLDAIRARMIDSGFGGPTNRSGVIHLEKRGTDSLPVMRALSFAYSLPLEIVEQAARVSRDQWRQAERESPRRSPKNVTDFAISS